MTQLSRGFWLAAVLVVLAVSAPCAAWYLAGSRSVEQQSDQLGELVRDRGHQIALGLAERLRGRLEAMADAESLRPFYYFQSSFHDPTSTCECSSRSPSPLATGPTDPFIATYFQIDSALRLSLPLAESRELRTQESTLQEELRGAVSSCVRAVQVIPTGWDSAEVPWAPGSAPDPAPLVDALASDPQLRVDPFQWHGIDLASGPTLVALRQVEGSREHLVQGFVLSHDAVQAWLDAAEWPSILRPVASSDPAAHEVQASVPLECAQWEVSVRVDAGLAEANAQATQLRGGFRRNFAMGSVAAGISTLALLSVLGWRERNERQRAHFAAAAAHELRTPIAGLRLYAEMLADSTLPESKRLNYAHRIAGEAARLGRVVANVLTYTGLERGSTEVELQELDLGELLPQILAPLRDSLSATTAELITVDSWPSLRTRADPDAVEQILRNLVDNAEKYSRDHEDRRIHIELLEGAEGPCIRVRDHGPGITPELGDRIFRAFERGRAPRQPAGLGLGLMLSQSLAAAQGAQLHWHGESDGGVSFSLCFPSLT